MIDEPESIGISVLVLGEVVDDTQVVILIIDNRWDYLSWMM
jgi:hypothetical protein